MLSNEFFSMSRGTGPTEIWWESKGRRGGNLGFKYHTNIQNTPPQKQQPYTVHADNRESQYNWLRQLQIMHKNSFCNIYAWGIKKKLIFYYEFGIIINNFMVFGFIFILTKNIFIKK